MWVAAGPGRLCAGGVRPELGWRISAPVPGVQNLGAWLAAWLWAGRVGGVACCRGRAGRIAENLWAWSGAGAGPQAVPTRPPAEARKGPFALPSPPGPHGGRSCGPRTRREPSSGEEAAPVTAMAAESALQVVEKLQARLATNPDPKKVSGGWAGGAGGRWAGRGPGNGRGPGEPGSSLNPEPGPAERRGVAESSQPAGASRLGAEDSRGARAAWPGGFPGARAAAPAVSPSQPSDAVRLAGVLWLRRSAARGPPLSSLSFNRENEESLGFSSSAPGPGVRVLHGSDLRKGGSRQPWRNHV